ncbi:MAG: hypothetical protein PF636_00425 [Actinomycetota bacterium]|nr:hypothetical protein [Actinomycetota bacterium]
MVQLRHGHIAVIAWGVAVALVAAVALLFAMPQPVGGAAQDPLDLTGDVEAGACAPCHLQIGATDTPGIMFSHGNHLVVSCDACHYRAAHEAGVTFTPTMESCFNCHGIAHGPEGELATAECADCHTPAFNLRPRTHGEDWAQEPHAARARADTNQCALCHNAPTDCDECHQELGLDVGPMPNVYLGILPDKLERPSVMVYPDRPTSMGQCLYCHPDIDDFLPGVVIFEHATHFEENFQCTVCHPQFGHGIEQVRRPDMLSCYRCHGLTHSAQGEVATEDCLACHPEEFELKPDDHTLAFEMGEHKERATREPVYCSMCHKPEMCVECHAGKREMPDGSAPRKIVPEDHMDGKWIGDHGPLFLAQEGACGSCHDAASCTRCHKTVMPHPADWLSDHTPDPGIGREDCNVCHTNRDRCQQCHHDQVKRAELVRENCVPCHDIMAQEPATEIGHKGFAEHAVHFDVAEKTSNGRPYRCDDCHVSFGSSSVADKAEAQQGHDLRLCYTCHGALDVENRLIAPYRGADLCRQCHKDINI